MYIYIQYIYKCIYIFIYIYIIISSYPIRITIPTVPVQRSLFAFAATGSDGFEANRCKHLLWWLQYLATAVDGLSKNRRSLLAFFLQFDTGENDDNHPMFKLNLEFLSTCCYEATDRAVPSSASCTRKGCGQHEIEPHTFQRQLQNLPGESLVTDPKQHEITWKTLGWFVGYVW